VVEMLARRRVDVFCFQEVQYKGEGCSIGDGVVIYMFWWSGRRRTREVV